MGILLNDVTICDPAPLTSDDLIEFHEYCYRLFEDSEEAKENIKNYSEQHPEINYENVDVKDLFPIEKEGQRTGQIEQGQERLEIPTEQIEPGLEGEKGEITKEIPTEQRKKISDSMKGKTLTEEHKKNLSKSLKNRKLSEEHKKKLSKPKPKVVCRLKDKKEMSLGNFNNWVRMEENCGRKNR